MGPQFLQNTDLFLECVAVLLPGVVDRSEFTLAAVIRVPLGKNMFCHAQFVFVNDHKQLELMRILFRWPFLTSRVQTV